MSDAPICPACVVKRIRAARSWNVDELSKLLDNGWQMHLFRNPLGSYTAVAMREGETMDDVRSDAWQKGKSRTISRHL